MANARGGLEEAVICPADETRRVSVRPVALATDPEVVQRREARISVLSTLDATYNSIAIALMRL